MRIRFFLFLTFFVATTRQNSFYLSLVYLLLIYLSTFTNFCKMIELSCKPWLVPGYPLHQYHCFSIHVLHTFNIHFPWYS